MSGYIAHRKRRSGELGGRGRPSRNIILDHNNSVNNKRNSSEDMEVEVDEHTDTMEVYEEKQLITMDQDEVLKRKFYEYKMDQLFKDLIVKKNGKRKRVKKEPQETDQRTRLTNIFNAISNGHNSLKTFEFTQFNGGGSNSVKVKISLVGFREEIEEKGYSWLLFDGYLSTTKEIGKHISLHSMNMEKPHPLDAIFLVAEVEVKIPMNPKDRKGSQISSSDQMISQNYYGVRSIGRRGSDGKLSVIHGRSSILTVSMEHSYAQNFGFNLSDTKSWISNRVRLEKIFSITEEKHRTESMCSGMPFVAYEISDEHENDDWEAIEEKVRKYMDFMGAEYEADPVKFITESGELLGVISRGKCPLTFQEYVNLDDHLNVLNEKFDDLEFRRVLTDKVVVMPREKKVHVPQQIQPQEARKPGPLDDYELPYSIIMQPIPFKTGKDGNHEWVHHIAPTNWKKGQAERKIRETINLPADCKEISIMLNNFFLEDEFRYTTKINIRRGMLKFFGDHEKEICTTDNELHAIAVAFKMYNKKIFFPQDYAMIFDKFSNLALAKQKRAELISPVVPNSCSI